MQGNLKDNKGLGEKGEELARNYLKGEGFKIVATNVRYKTGEIDIVASRDKELHFIEVKARDSEGVVSSLESITAQKRDRIRRTAEWYLSDSRNDIKKYNTLPCYFSVIGITYTGGVPQIECILDAFA